MSTPRNAEYTKKYNQKMFLRLLHRESLSRADVARRMGLTRASASLIADELLKEGWIVENKLFAVSKSGRPPVALSIAKDSCYAIGVFLNRDGCYAGIVSFNGQVICKARFKLKEETDKINGICQNFEKLISASGVKREKIMGVGISAPGPIDTVNGRILNPPGFNLWHNTDIAKAVSDTLKMPVYIENDASSIARFNIGKPACHGSENFLLLVVDRGVGSGIVLGGELFSPKSSFTGELGHTSIRFDGKACDCGNRGCLEAYAAIPNLLKDSRFSSWDDVVNEHYIADDAKVLFEMEAQYLSAGIINLANLMGIDTVLLSGDICNEETQFARLIENKVNERILHHPIKVYSASLDANIRSLASAEIVFDKYLSLYQ